VSAVFLPGAGARACCRGRTRGRRCPMGLEA
jgi:hypothetical protein